MSWQPAALRKHGTRAHSQFFELIEGHHSFTRHKLSNHRFNFPNTITVGTLLHQDVIFQRSMPKNDSSRNDEGGKDSVIYTGLIPVPNKTNENCGKTMVTGTMNRGSTAFVISVMTEFLTFK
jgi:hypothetical protein